MIRSERLSTVAAWCVVAMTIIAIAACSNRAQDEPFPDPSGDVSLKIDFGKFGNEINLLVPCYENSTVLSVISSAARNREIEGVKWHGSGETAFLTAINGVENQKSNGDNWVYRVNGKLGDSGCDVFCVKPDDVIVWSFGKYSPESDDGSTKSE